MDEFRIAVRKWLDENCPKEMRTPITDDADVCWGGRQWEFSSEPQRLWLERMAERGWTVPGWPAPYGGGGLSSQEQLVLHEEMARIDARAPLDNFGITMLGPVLLHFGTEEQKRRYLPAIARGQTRWCQGFSEPNAGSDLAALATRAEDRADHFLVNGQKIWTSYADKADAMFCLVRTDPDAVKQKGISFLLIDMDSPGISTRPIKLISGKSPFCETFLADVQVPKENLVGKLNHGWDCAKYLLTHERESISRGVGGLFDLETLLQQAQAKGTGELTDRLRSDIVFAQIDTLALHSLVRLYREEAERDATLVGDRTAVIKYLGAELNKRHAELRMTLAATDSLIRTDQELPTIAQQWLRSKGNSIEGGTSEIMLEIVSKRLLNLPNG